MRVGVLFDEGYADLDPAAFLSGYDWEQFELTAPVFDRIRELVGGGGFDVFLNLSRGYELDQLEPGGPGYLGVEVIQALESLEAPFTGADSRSYGITRDEQRAAATGRGILFVKGHQVESVEQAVELSRDLRYPLMVKHPGDRDFRLIPEATRVDTVDQLKVETARVINNFGAARVEEFVAGSAYSVLVVDDAADLERPFIYPACEWVFQPGQTFSRTDVTWAGDLDIDFRRVSEPGLDAMLQETAGRMYQTLGLTGYALADIRTDEAGRPVVLAMRVNPAIMSPGREQGTADYIILFDAEGFPGFLRRIFAGAVARRQKRLTSMARSSPTA